MAEPNNANPMQFRGMVQNIHNVYNATPDQVKSAGKTWYNRVNDAVSKGVRGTSMTPAHGAGLVAAVSPNMDWEKNNINAFHELHSLHQSHFDRLAANPKDRGMLKGMSINTAPTSNILKAHRIMQGEHPDDVLTAPKTNAFYRNIHEPETPGPVTVDGRAFDIAHNSMTGWTKNRGISGSMRTKKGTPRKKGPTRLGQSYT